MSRPFLRASAVLHADIALDAHMEPSLKAILESDRGDIEVIAQALKAEVADLFHVASVRESGEIVRVRLLLTSEG